jgi:AraC-like DNA-binding protein
VAEGRGSVERSGGIAKAYNSLRAISYYSPQRIKAQRLPLSQFLIHLLKRDMPQTHTPASMHRWSSLKSELLWTYDGIEQSYGEPMTVDHRQGYWLWLIHKGEVTVSVGDKQWTARPGQWILSPNAVISQRFSPNARILSIHFRCQWPTGENLFAGTEGIVWSAQLTPKLERSVVALQRLARRHFPEARLDLFLKSASYPLFMRFQHGFTLFLAEFSEAMTRFERQFTHFGTHDDRLTAAINCIHSSPQNEAFPWESLAKETGLSRKHLDRLFYGQFGTTSRSYWEKMKMDECIRLLETTSLPMKEVGYHLGFKQASHFSSWFTKHLGRAPGDHRENGARLQALGSVAKL